MPQKGLQIIFSMTNVLFGIKLFSWVKSKTVFPQWSVNGVSEVINSQAATCLSHNWDQTWSVFFTLWGSGQYIDHCVTFHMSTRDLS